MANYTIPATTDLTAYLSLLQVSATTGAGPTGCQTTDLSSYLTVLRGSLCTTTIMPTTDSMVLPFGAQPTRPTAGQLYPRPTP